MKKVLITLCGLLLAGGVTAQISGNRVKTNQVESKKITITGTAGSGYIDLVHQSANATGPGSGSLNTRLFANSGNVWMVTDTGTIAQITPTVSNPMTGAGDMIRGGAAGTPTNLPAGTSGQILVSQGAAAPAWTDIVTVVSQTGAVTDTSGSGTIGTLTNITNAAITLSAGTWMIFGNSDIYISNGATGTLAGKLVLIEDASTERSTSYGGSANAASTAMDNIFVWYTTTLTGSTNYKLAFTTAIISGSPTVSSLHANLFGQTSKNIWALKVK